MNKTLKEVEAEISKAETRIRSREKNYEIELSRNNKAIRSFTFVAWALVATGFIVTIFALLHFVKVDNFKLQDLGSFLSGGVASTWSLAGLFFIYIAFLGQKQQLLSQQLDILYSQAEVKYTRYELASQSIQMLEQNNTLRQQQFESTFFQMVNLYSSNISSIDVSTVIDNKKNAAKGRDCFYIFYKKIKENSWRMSSNIKHDPATFVQGFDSVFHEFKSDLSHYFRTLYHIVKFIHNSNIEDKKQYISIVRAQLSSYEQVLIFYNCLHENGLEKFKPLIEQYHIFKNLDQGLLFHHEHVLEYNPAAFNK